MGVVKRTQVAGRCEVRAFEVIYNNVPANLDYKSIMKALCAKKHGIYSGFMITHTEGEDTHLHCGLILRAKPKNLKWSGIKEYFTLTESLIPGPRSHIPTEHGPLTNPSRNLSHKLQTYWDYCTSEDKHEGQRIGEPFLYKWLPKTAAQLKQANPMKFLTSLIFENLSLDELDDHIDESTEWTEATRQYALVNYEKLEKMIEKLSDIRARKKQRAEYKKGTETYRPFQSGLTEIANKQNDRNIHCHHDPGNTGKNWWVDIESKRKDTLVLQSAETKRIAYAWNPKIHKRIIFDIPRGKMQYVNTSVIEKLKNGTLFSTMHHPKMKKSTFKPSIVILGNEQIPRDSWTDDRATYSTTDNTKFELLLQ